MTKTYNSPPNWPPPPAGWTPSPGWVPDPSWGPAPPGWQFWIEEQANASPATTATPSSAGDHELRVFLSYRRSDCQSQANGLYDGLRHRLPDARVFMDIDSIPAGVDFEEHIQREISVCDLVLVMIGDNWLDARPGSDVRRIDEPEDFVRLEIESALASPGVRTLPVLVENAQMPRANELPESIARLARINAFELNDLRWRADLDRLVGVVEAIGHEKGKTITHAPPSTRTPTPEPAPVLLADAGHAGREPVASSPSPSPSPSPMPMPGALVWMPLYTVGLGAWVPAVWAAWKLAPGDPVRMRLLLISGALLVAGAAGFIAVSAAPEDATGSATGPLSGIGAMLVIVTIIAGILVAKAYRTPPPRP